MAAVGAWGVAGAGASPAKLGADVAVGLYDMYEKTAREVPAGGLAGIARALAKGYQLADLAVTVGKGLRDAYRYLRTREVPYMTCEPVDPGTACRGDRRCAACARRVRGAYETAWGWIQRVVENGEETAAYVSRAVAFGDFGSALPLFGFSSIFAQAAWWGERKKIGVAYERYAGIYRRKLAQFLYDLDEAYWRFSRCLGGDGVVDQARWYLDVGHPAVRELGDCYAHLPYRRLAVDLELPPGSMGWLGVRRRGLPLPSLPGGTDGRGRSATASTDGAGADRAGGRIGGGADAGTGAGRATAAGGARGGAGAPAAGRADGQADGRILRPCGETPDSRAGEGRREAECPERPDR